MRGSKLDAIGDVAIDGVVIRRVGRAVAVIVMVMVTGARQRRPVVIRAKRAVEHQGKRRHDRQTGREAPEMRSDGTNHRSTRASCIAKILVTGFQSVQSGRSMIGPNCAYLVAFGKSPGIEP